MGREDDRRHAREWSARALRDAGVLVTAEELERMEVADLGLAELPLTGAQIVTLVSTDYVGAKLLVLMPEQFFPQHRHPPLPGDQYPGKQEIVRGQWGEVSVFLPGERTFRPRRRPPPHRERHCTVWREHVVGPGAQLICPANTWHWFRAGPDGAVVWSFSSRVTDAQDEFADPEVRR